jgi:glycine cleavage system H protein
MEFPKELKYSKEHSWLKTQGSKAAIGITEFAQIKFGKIVYVNLPSTGSRFDKGEVFGSVEVLKTTSDLYMPVGGVVLEVNNNLLKQADLLNKRTIPRRLDHENSNSRHNRVRQFIGCGCIQKIGWEKTIALFCYYPGIGMKDGNISLPVVN